MNPQFPATDRIVQIVAAIARSMRTSLPAAAERAKPDHFGASKPWTISPFHQPHPRHRPGDPCPAPSADLDAGRAGNQGLLARCASCHLRHGSAEGTTSPRRWRFLRTPTTNVNSALRTSHEREAVGGCPWPPFTGVAFERLNAATRVCRHHALVYRYAEPSRR